MNICISGSRSIRSYWLFSRLLRNQLSKVKDKDVTILQGECFYGIDYMVALFCKRNKVNCKGYPANWDKFKKAAGFIRNKEMLEDANILIAFHDKRSNGTQHAIDTALKMKIPSVVFILPADEFWREKRLNKIKRLTQLRVDKNGTRTCR